jgi:hypothetical protein
LQADLGMSSYQNAMQAYAPVTQIGQMLGNRALQNAMGQSPGLKAIGNQFAKGMRQIGTQSNLPSSSRTAQEQALRERFGSAQATEMQRAFAGDVGLYSQLAGAAGGIAQGMPQYQVDPNADAATIARIRASIYGG